MQHDSSGYILSATDLVNHLGCEHLTQLQATAARGERKRPNHGDDPELDLLRRKGQEHENRYFATLEASGTVILDLAPDPRPRTPGELTEATHRTREAMREGVPVLYQPTLFDGRWRGQPDFLIKQPTPSTLGPWSYAPLDAKLARSVKAGALIQLCVYADLLHHTQGTSPDCVGLLTGDGTEHWERLADYSAYYRSIKHDFEAQLDARPHTYPDPVDHCRVCDWYPLCADRRRDDDHLCRVAGITRVQTKHLTTGAVSTLTALGALARTQRITDITEPTLVRLREQARLQGAQYRDGRVRHELIAPDPNQLGQGLGRLPEPSPGDIFLDIESDPWIGSEGREYLLGTVTQHGREVVYRPLWCHTAEEEKAGLEQLVDFVLDRRRAFPGMHLYHYGAYEVAALKRLVGRYGTRIDELDVLLRGEVLVDLFAVVRQGVRISQESYSLKKVEKLYMPDREGPVTRPGFATFEYERWLDSREATVLAGIAAYNRDDCVSTWKLRAWLEEQRREAERAFSVTFTRPEPKTGEPAEELSAQDAETRRTVEALTAGLPAERAFRSPDEQGRWLLAQLLAWHRREGRPEWWAWYRLKDAPMEDLEESPEALADLEPLASQGTFNRSIIHRYAFDPDQEHKFEVGDKPVDPATDRGAGTVYAIDNTTGRIDLTRATSNTAPHPKALIPAKPIPDKGLRTAIARVAEHLLAAGSMAGSGPYRAVRDLLVNAPPRVKGLAAGSPLATVGEDPTDAACRLVKALDESCLPIQGPPGAGKTYTAARMILALLADPLKRIGIASSSHAAITNLLDAVCDAADTAGLRIPMVQRCANEDAACDHPCVTAGSNEDVESGLASGRFRIAAGTAWLFAREQMAGLCDVLFVDEAGQMSLANVVAMGGAARSIVLLGDPNQLPQVTKGSHPEGAGVSALEHVLGPETTMPNTRGLFLDTTWRLHPDVCSYISRAFYNAELQSEASTHQQQVFTADADLSGTGLRLHPVAHEHNGARSPEEAETIAGMVENLLEGTWTNNRGITTSLTLGDILIVSPYNLQVAEIARRVAARVGLGVRVGTVDKFQGQEGAVLLYSMATSSADDAPRNIEFLYSRNRLNVAISRARALAVLVCNPALFRIRCRTPEEMRMANAFCLTRESATRGRL